MEAIDDEAVSSFVNEETTTEELALPREQSQANFTDTLETLFLNFGNIILRQEEQRQQERRENEEERREGERQNGYRSKNKLKNDMKKSGDVGR